MMRLILILMLPASLVNAKGDSDSEIKRLFEVFSTAMKEARYAPLFRIFTSKSSNQYRELMLNYYEAQSKEGKAETPPGKDGKPVSLPELEAMSNGEFWTVHVAWFKNLEDEASRKLTEAHGALGTPNYTMAKTFRDGDRVFVLAERSFKIASDLKMPYQVLEFVMEEGTWKMEVPRDMLWQIAQDTAAIEKK